jgi:hypothetical protein
VPLISFLGQATVLDCSKHRYQTIILLLLHMRLFAAAIHESLFTNVLFSLEKKKKKNNAHVI